MAESFVDTLKTELMATAAGARAASSNSPRPWSVVQQPSPARRARRHPPVEFEFARQLQTLNSADLDERPCGPLSRPRAAAQTKEVAT